ncbi:MAG: Nramp family divalent metal transporter [Bacillota bacterium]|nr:Nramp family divalent metal transporter [Bacillota bacterium]
MKGIRNKLSTKGHHPVIGAIDFMKYIGPGLIVTVGFIDPGNWASNLSAGSDYGYRLLWMVTLSTIMLILLQHNAAHLGIATGDCLSEAATKHLNPILSKTVLSTSVLASISTAMAEILGGAIALQLLFNIPLKVGAVIILAFVLWMLFTNSYRRLEKWIIGFVSIIGISFIYELSIVHMNWGRTLKSAVIPSFPKGSMLIIMSVLGAVVMPHNLFLHSEIIQSRQWNKENPEVIKRQLKYEFADTLFSMLVGWAINSAMIILAASTFFNSNIKVDELVQAQHLMDPLLGKGAAIIFGTALLFAGISSATTAGMAGGSIVAGMFKEPYDIKDIHTRLGVGGVLCWATFIIFLISDPFKGLVYSQMFLSMQLPFTIFLQVYITSSKKVMGQYRNSLIDKFLLLVIGVIVSVLNIMLLLSYI